MLRTPAHRSRGGTRATPARPRHDRRRAGRARRRPRRHPGGIVTSLLRLTDTHRPRGPAAARRVDSYDNLRRALGAAIVNVPTDAIVLSGDLADRRRSRLPAAAELVEARPRRCSAPRSST
ncbi:hypothetical protein HBB16_04580 [Pseudonocardia sp. MCCB 268]|nr:hypothetical protein [Pseudonocardia cytotoxica]